MNLLTLPCDQYQRYRGVAELLGRVPAGTPAHVLEVGGGGESHLAAFLPHSRITIADIELRDLPPGVSAVRADACTTLPFRDRSFPAAVTIDTLEHLPASARRTLVRELRRVAAGAIVLACPVADDGAPAAELALDFAYQRVFGERHRWLAEHRAMGLPMRADIETELATLGGAWCHTPNGYLPDWQLLMFLHLLIEDVPLAAAEMATLRALDALYNERLYPFSNRAPAYRALWVHTPAGSEGLPQPSSLSPGLPPADLQQEFAAAVQQIGDSLPATHARLVATELRTLRARYAETVADRERVDVDRRQLEHARLAALDECQRLRANHERIDADRRRIDAQRIAAEEERKRLQIDHDRLSHSWLRMDAERRRMIDERNAALTERAELRWRVRRLRHLDRALDVLVPPLRRLLRRMPRPTAAPGAVTSASEGGTNPRTAPVQVVVVVPPGAERSAVERTRVSLEAQHVRPSGIDEMAWPIDWARVRSNAAYLAIVLAGDRLAPTAFAEIARALAARPDATIVYADDDEWPTDGHRGQATRRLPWDPELVRAGAPLGALTCFAAQLVARIPAGSSLAEVMFAVALAAAEQDERAVHVPLVLSHVDPSTKPLRQLDPTRETTRRLLADHFAQRGEQVEIVPAPPGFAVHRPVDARLRVSILIPFRDRPEMLERCIASIRRHTHRPEWELVLVDNCSSDPRTEELLTTLTTAEPERIRVLRYAQRFNFSAINNAAAEAARGDVLVLLNNDTEILTDDWLTLLTGLANRPDVGAVGPLLLFPDGRIQHCGIGLGMGEWPGRPHGVAALILIGCRPEEADALLHAYDRRVAAVTGACLAVRRDRYLAVGGMDDNLHTDFNDVDLCLKLVARGFMTLYTPHVRVYHYESASRSGRPIDPREVALMYERWGDYLAYDPFSSEHVDRVGRPVPPSARGAA